jgi:uncharacterized membrane protein
VTMYSASVYVMAALGGFGVILLSVVLVLAAFMILVAVLTYFSGGIDGETETRSKS